MPASSRTPQLLALGLFALCTAGLGCSRVPSSSAVRAQGAVVTAVQPAAGATAPEPAAPAARVSSVRSMPELSLRPDAVRPDVREDEDHQQVQAARTERGWAMVWTDSEHQHAAMGMVDAQGRALEPSTMLRSVPSDEEEVWAPSIASTPQGFGVSWVDRAGGQVRFQRLDANGHPLGNRVLLHDGLALPRVTRTVWTGTEFAVAVGLEQGLFFARVSSEGQRVGEGVLVAEQGLAGGIDELSATETGFYVRWHDAGEGGASHDARLSRQGRVVGNLASSGRPARRATL